MHPLLLILYESSPTMVAVPSCCSAMISACLLAFCGILTSAAAVKGAAVERKDWQGNGVADDLMNDMIVSSFDYSHSYISFFLIWDLT